MINLLLVFALIFLIVFVVTSMMIVHEVSKRGTKINIPLLRLFIIKYIHQYRKMTLEETGKVGPLYYPCLTSINLAFILTILYFVL